MPTASKAEWIGSSGCNVANDCRRQCADGWRGEGQKTSRRSKNGRSGKKESGREGVPRRSEERTRVERKARPLEDHAISRRSDFHWTSFQLRRRADDLPALISRLEASLAASIYVRLP